MTMSDLKMFSGRKAHPSSPFLSKEEGRELDVWYEETYRGGGPRKEDESAIMYIIRKSMRSSVKLGEGIIGVMVIPIVILLLPFWCILRAFGGFRI